MTVAHVWISLPLDEKQLFYVRFEPPHVILVHNVHGQMYHLIPHAVAVELAFVFI